MTFHDGKPLEPLVNERWEDFNVKVNTTIPQILHWVYDIDNTLNTIYYTCTMHMYNCIAQNFSPGNKFSPPALVDKIFILAKPIKLLVHVVLNFSL